MAKRKLGTFVSQRSPHLFEYALVFPHDPNRSLVWSNFFESLRGYAGKLNLNSEKHINFFYGVDQANSSSDSQRLQQLVENHQLAGIIFATPPYELEGTKILNEPDIPRVYIGGFLDRLSIPSVGFGGESSALLGARYLVSQSRHRIAFFATDPDLVDSWLKLPYDAPDLQIMTRRHWSFALAPNLPDAATACVRLLMDLPEADRPNGIIVLDDHLTEAVERGLLSSSDPKAVETKVVASCNFPDRFVHQLPIKRLGYEAGDIIESALSVLAAVGRGEKVRRAVTVLPHFDDTLLDKKKT